MARAPFAVWMPIPDQYLSCNSAGKRLAKVAHNRHNIHITAGLGSPFGFFSAPGRASSEFFVSKVGTIFQFGDSDLRFEADLEGNDATHSVENEGVTGPLTAEQVKANAMIFRWLRETYGVANQIATSSKIGAESAGLSWHRLGIDGNFPALPSMLAGRTQRGGGMHYSNSRGKLCPTDAVILQIPEIFTLSQTIDLGSAPIVEVSNPTQPSVQPTTSSAPTNPFGRPLLDEDGKLGALTISEAQRQAGTPVDGYISGQRITNGVFHNEGTYSSLIAKLQRKHGCKEDGWISYPKSGLVLAMEKRFGTKQDSYISWPVSSLAKQIQASLNRGDLF